MTNSVFTKTDKGREFLSKWYSSFYAFIWRFLVRVLQLKEVFQCLKGFFLLFHNVHVKRLTCQVPKAFLYRKLSFI